MSALARFAAPLLLVAAALPGAASADEGRVEINQARALARGVTGSDGPGFPVEIDAPGSYVLTSDLEVPPGKVGIDIMSPQVTLDLNGFHLRSALTGNTGASGVFASNDFAREAMIRNGSITDFDGWGIELGEVDRVRVDDVLVADNGQGGIHLGQFGRVTRAHVHGNKQFGLLLGDRTVFQDCSISATQGGPSVSGGVELAFNACDDGGCDRRPRPRRYYLSRADVAASAAPFACAPGYHFASIWEIRDTSNLQYDTTLGATHDDSGEGPPQGQGASGNSFGWVRTGWFDGGAGSGADETGFANCLAYTVDTPGTFGTAATPSTGIWASGRITTKTPTVMDPWFTVAVSCSNPRPVWCMEDR